MPAPAALVPLPAQPADVAWPTTDWPRGEPLTGRAAELFEAMCGTTDQFGTTYAVLVAQNGHLRAEWYGNELEHWDRPHEPVAPETRLLSWSMAKSITHALVGICVGDGLLEPDAPASVAAWADDERSAITLQNLLEIRDGLDFAEDYVDERVSDVIHMLFSDANADVFGYASSRPLAHQPGEVFNYSSGTSNVVARLVGDAVGGTEAAMRKFMQTRLFAPIGMRTADPRFDDAGTFIGSSYVYATAEDFARFGLLYLRDGVWDEARVLPPGWVDHGRTFRSVDPTDGRAHGAHWWVLNDDHGSFRASGYDGQAILLVPDLDLLVVRLGKSEAQSDQLSQWRTDLIAAFANE